MRGSMQKSPEPRVFTPHLCATLAEAGRLIRALRSAGIRATELQIGGLRYGAPAELKVICPHARSFAMSSDLVHVTRTLPEVPATS